MPAYFINFKTIVFFKFSKGHFYIEKFTIIISKLLAMKFLFLSLIFLFIKNFVYADNYQTGQIIINEFKINKNFTINLSKGKWNVVRKQTMNAYGIKQSIVGIVRLKENQIVELIEIYEGNLSGKRISDVDQAVYEIVFKNKYDGCYERPEYYHLEFFTKGRVHNCMVVRHWDTEKELYRPDDPEKKGSAYEYKNWIKKNSIIIPKIVLASNHSYFSRHSGGNWFSIIYVIDPKILGAPESKFYGEENSEYHRHNIEKFPEHKKIMNKWMSISSKRHQEFENLNKAKTSHRLKLDNYILNLDLDESQKKNDIFNQILKLNDLYKQGVLTQDEFEKAKKKILK